MVPIGFEVEGDVSAGAWPEGREGYVGGLGEGYGVPDVSYGKQKKTPLKFSAKLNITV